MRLYEQETIRAVTGPAIRPGGLPLTRRLIEQCALPAGARVLDVGCGAGATVHCLQTEYRLRAVGLDLSARLLQAGQAGDLPLLRAGGERLPFGRAALTAIIAECSLSLIGQPERALAEFRRVLIPGGRLILTDIYIQQAAETDMPLVCCVGGARTGPEIMAGLEAHRFRVTIWEDHTAALRHLAGQLVWTYGSLAHFWRRTGVDPAAMERAIRRARPGYYALIAEREE